MSYSFADYVRHDCRKNRITLEKLAENAGMARGTLYRLLDGDSSPKVTHILSLAAAMNTHPNILLRLKWPELGVLPIAPNRVDDAAPLDSSGFRNETVPDGSLVAAGAVFEKRWSIQNTGQTTWENRYLLCIDEPVVVNNYPDNQALDAHFLTPQSKIIPIPTTQPQETVDVSVMYRAPTVAGRYVSYWKMVDEHGKICFANGIGLSVSIMVSSMGVSF